MSIIELNREQPIFDRILSIQLHNNINQDIKTNQLSFRILHGIKSTNAVTGQNERLFHFEITDELDPYFLFVLDVSEQDFHHLKREQALLVEFNVFPFKLIELLDSCISSSSTTITTTGETNTASSFIAKLDTNTGVLSVVEANLFKQLTHIYLQMRPGNDASIKSYLASRLQLATSVIAKQSSELDTLTHQLKVEREASSSLATEFNSIKLFRDNDVQSLQSLHTQEVSQIQIQSIELMEQARVKYEGQIESLRASLDGIQQSVQIKAAAYEQTIAELMSDKHGLEFKVKDVSRQLASSIEEKDRACMEVDKMYISRSSIEETRIQLERELARNIAKVESLLQQVHDKDDMIVTIQSLQKAAEESKANTESKLDMYISNSDMLQEKLQLSSMEIDRGNNAIMILQNDVKQLREKVKTKSEVIRRQEALVGELRNKNGDCERQILTLQDSILSLKQQLSHMQHQLSESNDKIAESTKLISSNQEVITYLNEEINKWQLGVRANTTLSTHNTSQYMPSSSYYSHASPDSVAHGKVTHAYNSDAAATGTNTLKSQYNASKLDWNELSENSFIMDYNNSTTGESVGNLTIDKETYIKGLNNLGLNHSFGGGYEVALGLDSFDYYNTSTNNKRY